MKYCIYFSGSVNYKVDINIDHLDEVIDMYAVSRLKGCDPDVETNFTNFMTQTHLKNPSSVAEAKMLFMQILNVYSL